MNCKLTYTLNSPFKEKAEEIHKEIYDKLLKDPTLSIREIDGNDFFYAAPDSTIKFKPDYIISEYGNVLVIDNNYISINSLESEQYLNHVVDKRILGIKDYTELTIEELIDQDIKFSPVQLSDSLKKIRSSYFSKYNWEESKYEEAEREFKDFLRKSDIVFDYVLTNNDQYVGLYYQKGENPKFSSLNGGLENAKMSLKKDRDVINKKEFYSTEISDNVTFTIVKELNINEELSNIAVNGTSYQKDLLSILSDYKINLNIYEVSDSNFFGLINDKGIFINKRLIDENSKNKKLNNTHEYNRVLLHEIIHFLSVESIKKNPLLKKQLSNLIEIADIKSWNLGYTKANPFKDEFEFVAEVFTDENLQEVLSKISYKNDNVWNKFIEIIKNAIQKLIGKNINNTLLQEVIKIGSLTFKESNIKDSYMSPLPNLQDYLKTLNYEQKVLLENLLDQLKKVAPNFTIQLMDKMLENGEQAFTDFRDSVIQIGANADFSDITEEIFHVLVESIDQDFMVQFDNTIVHTEIYNEVVKMYGLHPDYDDKKLKREAVVKLITQMSGNVPLEKYLTTKNESIIYKIRKAITNLLKKLFNTYSKIDANDFYSLTESIMYSNVPYVKKDLTDRGKFESRKIPYDKSSSLQLTTLDINLSDNNFNTLLIHVDALFNKVINKPTELGLEVLDILKANYDMSTKNYLPKLKIYLNEEVNNDILKEFLTTLNDYYPNSYNLTVSDILKDNLLILPNEEGSYFIKKDVTFTTIKNSDGIITLDSKTDVNNKYYLDTLRKNITRFTTIESKDDDYEEAKKFFNNISDSNLSELISKLAFSVERNLNKLKKLNLVNTLSSNTHAINTNLIKQLKIYNEKNDLIQQVTALHSSMNDFKLLFNDLELLLKNNNNLDLNDLNDIMSTIIVWNRIINSLKKQLSEERSKGNRYDNYETYISQFSRASEYLEELISTKIAQKSAESIEQFSNKFNESLFKDIEELELKLQSETNEKLKNRIQLEINRLKETYERQKIKDGEILNNLLQTTINDIDSNTHKLNLNPLFDRWLTNIRFSGDPILASFGANMEEIYNNSEIELQVLLNTFVDLGKDITELGGEVEVGKKLTRLVKTHEYVTKKVTEIHNGVSIKYDKKFKQEVIKKQIVNQWGNQADYWVQDYKGTYGDLLMEIDNINSLINEGVFETEINNEKIDLKERKNQLYKIKKDFKIKNFHQVYTEEYYNIKNSIFQEFKDKTGKSIEELEAIFNRLDELKESLQDKRDVLKESLKNINSDNKESILQLRSDIGLLTNQINGLYSLTEGDDKIGSEMLLRYREKYTSFVDKTPNVEVFVRDLNILINQLDINGSKELIKELRNSYILNGVVLPLDKILTNLTSLHIKLNTNKSGLSEDALIVRKFLDESMWYKTKDEFYAERSQYYNAMSLLSLYLNDKPFESYVYDNDDEALIKQAEIEGEFIKDNKDYIIVEASDVIDENIGTLLGKDKDGIIVLDYYGSKLVVKIENGKIARKDNQDINNDVSSCWKNILDITRKYRDKFGYVYNMTDEDQMKVNSFEQDAYDLIALLNTLETREKITRSKEYILKEIKQYSDYIEVLQTNVIIETYHDSIRRLFDENNITTVPEFKTLVNTPSINFERNLQRLLNKIQKTLKLPRLHKLKGYQDDDGNFHNMSYVEFLNYIKNIQEEELQLTGISVPLKDFTESDFKILQSLLKFHVVKTHKLVDGESEVIPVYNFRKVIPNDIENSIEKNLDNKYTFKEVKSIFRTENKFKEEEFLDYKGDFQLKDSPINLGLIKNEGENSNYALIKGFESLDTKLKNIHKTWIEDNIIYKQRESANNNNYKINTNSYLGYTVPYLERQYSELGWLEGLKSFFRDIFGLRNPNESGDFSFEPLPDTASQEQIQEDVNKKKSYLESFTNILTKFLNLDGVGKYLRKSQDFIPVDYTHYVEGSNVTDNIFLAYSSYMSSFIKAKNINQNYYKIKSLRDTLRKNDSFKDYGKTYKRLEILEANINSEIFRNNIGVKNPVTQVLRFIKKLMVYKSQSTANIVGWTKNLEAGLIQNYINSITVSDNFIWDKNSRLVNDTSTTLKAFKLAYESFGIGSNLEDESLTQYLSRQLNPQMKNIRDLVRNTDRFNTKNLIFEEKIAFAGLKIGETIISYQMMLDIIGGLKLKQGENEIYFLDAFEKINGKWKIREGITTANGKEQFSEKHFLEIKKLIDRGRFQTMGHSKFKGRIFNDSYVRSLFFFVNYLVPLMQNVLTLQRRDFYTNQIIENFNISLLRYFAKSLQYLSSGHWYWNYMSTSEKRNVIKGIVTYTSLYTLVKVMQYLFNFDPEEKDAYKKLKANNNIQNFLLLTTLKTASEIEQLSLANPLSRTYIPVITANYNAIKNPTLLRLLSDLGKTGQLTIETGLYTLGFEKQDDVFYSKSQPQNNIKQGDSKLLHQLNKFNPINTEKNYNFINQVRLAQTLGNQ